MGACPSRGAISLGSCSAALLNASRAAFGWSMRRCTCSRGRQGSPVGTCRRVWRADTFRSLDTAPEERQAKHIASMKLLASLRQPRLQGLPSMCCRASPWLNAGEVTWRPTMRHGLHLGTDAAGNNAGAPSQGCCALALESSSTVLVTMAAFMELRNCWSASRSRPSW